jgi:hypothetical protein
MLTASVIGGHRMYIGEAYFSGEWHSGVYPPIVDIELWNQVHAKLAKQVSIKVDIAALKKLIRELVQIRGVDSIDSEKPGKTRPKPS